MFRLIILLLFLVVLSYAQDYMTCSRSTDTFQIPSTLPTSSSGVVQRPKPGKRGPIGPKGSVGPRGPKGEPSLLEDSEIDSLKDRINVLATMLNNSRSDGWYTPLYQYKLLTTARDWENSRRKCQAIGGDLASFGMRDFSRRMEIVHGVGATSGGGVFIGLRKEFGDFRWIDGVSSTSENTHWIDGQPDNYRGNEDCGEILHRSYGEKTNDIACGTGRRALCEKQINL